MSNTDKSFILLVRDNWTMVPVPSFFSVKVTKKYLDQWKHSLRANYLSIVEIKHCKFRYCIKIQCYNGQKAKTDVWFSIFRKKRHIYLYYILLKLLWLESRVFQVGVRTFFVWKVYYFLDKYKKFYLRVEKFLG